MLKKAAFILPVILGLFLLFSSYSGEGTRYPGGSPGGYTGSPGDGQTCTVCHGGSATQVTGWISSDIPVEGYLPGNMYTITVTVSGNGKKGFEVSPQDLSGNLIGTLTAGTGTKLVAGNTAVTQSSSSTANPKTWSFGWIAPNPGVGEVTFYGAFTVSEPVTKLSTLTVPQQLFTGFQHPSPFSIHYYPNPASRILKTDFHFNETTSLTVSLITLAGSERILLEQQVYIPGHHSLTFSLEDMSSGTYLLSMRKENYQIIRKLVIQ